MEVYCVKEKRFTPNVPGSETFAIAKNGRRLLKVKCASCGITKTRFISARVKRKWGFNYDMRIYAGNRVDDPTNPLYERPRGQGFDLHKAIGKLPKPKKGWTLPGHNYTGPYNPLEKQLSYDPQTGKILKIYQQPTGTADAVSMQHDVDYAVCAGKKNEKNCKHDADKKMVKALDAIPKNKRQWGHAMARNAISSKQKVGLGVGEMINEKSATGSPDFRRLKIYINCCPELINSCLTSIGRVTLPRGRLTQKPACSAKSFGLNPTRVTEPCNEVVYDKKTGKYRNKYCD